MSELTPGEMSQSMRALADALTSSLRRGLKAGAKAVNEAARVSLSGPRKAVPWSYPVPARTGNLRRNQQFESTDTNTAYVFNTAPYAAAIHNGYVSQWAGRGKHSMRMKASPRPFLDDAVDSAQPLMVIQRELEGTLAAWG